MFKKLLTLAAGAVTAVVTACGDAPRVTTRYMDPTGTWDEMTGAAGAGADSWKRRQRPLG